MDDNTLKWLESEFNSVQLQLGSIKEQTNKVELKTIEIEKTINILFRAESKHYELCPLRKELSEMRKENDLFKEVALKVRIVERNYKTILISASCLIAGMLIGAFLLFTNLNNAIDQNSSKIKSVAIMKEADDQLKTPNK